MRRRFPPLALGTMLLLHAGLAPVWLGLTGAPRRPAPSSPAGVLRLVPVDGQRKPAGTAPRQLPRPPAAALPPVQWLFIPTVGGGPTAPVPGAGAGPTAGWAPPPAGGPPGPTTGAPPAELDLRLPPAAHRGAPALRSPRPPKPRSVEARIVRDLDPTVIATDLSDGRRRWQRGRDCIEAREARIARIDPFNQSVQPAPRQLEACGP